MHQVVWTLIQARSSGLEATAESGEAPHKHHTYKDDQVTQIVHSTFSQVWQ